MKGADGYGILFARKPSMAIYSSTRPVYWTMGHHIDFDKGMKYVGARVLELSTRVRNSNDAVLDSEKFTG